jgi:hypothetical protein
LIGTGFSEAAARRALNFTNLDSSQKIGTLNIIAGICLQQDRLPEAVEYFTVLTRPEMVKSGENLVD